MRGVFDRFQDIILSVDNLSHLCRKNLEIYKAKLTFIDGSNLRISEKCVYGNLENYSYYWLNGQNQIIIGWDNAPHHKGLPNFPHHKHTPGRILASYETDLDAVLKVIKRILSPQ
ncbi:hypothetical protein H8E77_36375 [bacterium]|nr:hypothetical protein [bacterium]